MNDEQLLKLVKHKEQAVVGLLLVNELVELIQEADGVVLDNIKLTDKGKDIVGRKLYFTVDWLNIIRSKWPASSRGNKHLLKDRCELFISKTGASLGDIETICDRWLIDKSHPFCGYPENFFYKKDAEDRMVSIAEDMYEELNTVAVDPRYRQA